MPIHDWTRGPAGLFYHFQQDWSIDEFIDDITILPVTAYEVPMPGDEVEL